MSEINALPTEKLKKKKKHHKSLNTNEAEIKSFEITCVEVNEQNGSDFTENDKKIKNKKNFIDGLNLIELNTNTTNDVEIKLLENTSEQINEQNIIDSYSRKNVNCKRKPDKHALADISLVDNCSIDNDNVPTKKKKKNNNESLNLIEIK